MAGLAEVLTHVALNQIVFICKRLFSELPVTCLDTFTINSLLDVQES